MLIQPNLRCLFHATSLDEKDVLTLCVDGGIPETLPGEVIKHDKTTSVFRAGIGPHKAVIKRYNTKNLWHLVRRNFQKSRAANCMQAIVEFRRSGLLAPSPLAVVEQNLGPFAGISWFMAEDLALPTLQTYLQRSRSEHSLDALVLTMTDIFATLQQDRLSHGDMKATNLLVDDAGGTMRIFLIDFDAARQHRQKTSHAKALLRDKNRFLKNWREDAQLLNRFNAMFDLLKI